MQSILFTILVLVLSIFYLDAFLPSERSRTRSQILRARWRGLSVSSRSKSSIFPSVATATTRNNGNALASTGENNDGDGAVATISALTHKDIVWKLRPPAGTGRRKRLWLRFAANVIRLDCMIFRKQLPTSLCPKGNQALLEAHTHDEKGKLVKIGRFGFTTERGAPTQQIQETVSDLYGINQQASVGAIIYMFVEPEYRARNVGTLALEVIRCIHAIQNIDFTVLVVDDNGSGKLNDWYLKRGYLKAPKLQNMLGSPDAVHGISMITPTNLALDEDCRIKWW